MRPGSPGRGAPGLPRPNGTPGAGRSARRACAWLTYPAGTDAEPGLLAALALGHEAAATASAVASPSCWCISRYSLKARELQSAPRRISQRRPLHLRLVSACPRRNALLVKEAALGAPACRAAALIARCTGTAIETTPLPSTRRICGNAGEPTQMPSTNLRAACTMQVARECLHQQFRTATVGPSRCLRREKCNVAESSEKKMTTLAIGLRRSWSEKAKSLNADGSPRSIKRASEGTRKANPQDTKNSARIALSALTKPSIAGKCESRTKGFNGRLTGCRFPMALRAPLTDGCEKADASRPNSWHAFLSCAT